MRRGGRQVEKKRKKPKAKNDPKLAAAARELRDRWLEQINSGQYLPTGNGKYEVSRGAGDGGVAVEDLQHEQGDRVRRVQHAIAPQMTRGGKTFVDLLCAAEKLQRFRFDPSKHRGDNGHPWPPLSMGDIRHHHSLRRLRFARL